MKVTEDTTLGQLAIAVAAAGIKYLSLKPSSRGYLAGLMADSQPEWIMGQGPTIATAIEAALEELHKLEGFLARPS